MVSMIHMIIIVKFVISFYEKISRGILKRCWWMI